MEAGHGRWGKKKDARQPEMQQHHEEADRTSWQRWSTVRRGRLLSGRQSSAYDSRLRTFEQEQVARIVISDFVATAAELLFVIFPLFSHRRERCTVYTYSTW